jgi:hypothetical protein
LNNKSISRTISQGLTWPVAAALCLEHPMLDPMTEGSNPLLTLGEENGRKMSNALKSLFEELTLSL